MFGGFFQGKRILVTGVSGVKGSWLALLLLEAGSRVVGVDIGWPRRESNFWAAGLRDKITFVQGDVTDLALMRQLMNGVDGVFHLAAVGLVHEAQRNPWEAYRTNSWGVVTVLEALRLSESVDDAVFITSDKVYRSKNGEAWIEADPLVASGPYPVSKACAEYIIADYHGTYLREAGKHVAVARAGNVLIGGDFHSSQRTEGAGRICVDCVEALMENRAPEIFKPRFTRPYTYGLDVLAGYMTLMSKLDSDNVDGEAFNFGPQEQNGIENGVLATKICELWGSGITWRSGPSRDEPFEKQSLSWEKARERLAWQPVYTLDEALRDTVRWYKRWAEERKVGGEGCMDEVNSWLITRHRDAAARLGLRSAHRTA
jgi:CDP-glucose 4,6-dehydratase